MAGHTKAQIKKKIKDLMTIRQLCTKYKITYSKKEVQEELDDWRAELSHPRFAGFKQFD